MFRIIKRVICTAMVLFITLSGSGVATAADGNNETEFMKDNPELLEKLRGMVRRAMDASAIPGVSVALLDDKSVLWTEGFGYTDRDNKTPINPDTIFSLQSISKCVTATAIMKAVKDGLLDLDKPITEYLPEFTVNSIFEEHPERKITLRLLLSHKAGLTHEAPVGNNLDSVVIGTFEDHVKSISTTWLRFPVGQNYAYSNLGIDLAGYILQKVSGKTFQDYVDENISVPLGMKNSTFDMEKIKENKNRAIGHDSVRWRMPLEIPMIPEGGYYSSANDMARFVQYHMNGNVSEEMYKIPNPIVGQSEGYALGVDKYYRYNTVFYNHGGGGFGFLTSIIWYPKLKLGVVVLTNSADNPKGAIDPYELGQMLLGAVIDDTATVFNARMKQLQQDKLPLSAVSYNDIQNRRRSDIYAAIIGLEGTPAPDEKRWSQYVGTYTQMSTSVPLGNIINITMKNGRLFWDSWLLNEVQPGLFITLEGETLDFRGAVKTCSNIAMEKLEPGLVFYGVFLAICIAVFIASIILLLIRSKKKGQNDQARPILATTARAVQGANAALCLIMVGILAYTISILVSTISGNALNVQDYGIIRLVISAIRVISPAILVLVAAKAAFCVVAWKNNYWNRFMRIWYSGTVVIGILFVLLMFRVNVVLF